MKRAGLVGGLGPESTIDYYRRLIAAWESSRPGTSPALVIDSLDALRGLHLAQHDRAGLVEYLLESLRRLAGARCQFAAITANTAHMVFDELAARAPLPLLSMIEACADEAKARGLARVGLLGTRFTMEGTFYGEVFGRRGIEVAAPGAADRAWVHERYVGQLLRGDFRDDTREGFGALIRRMKGELRLDGIVLAGTELPLLLKARELAGLPLLDTTALHVAAIIERLRSD